MFYKNIMHKKIFHWNIRSFKKIMNLQQNYGSVLVPDCLFFSLKFQLLSWFFQLFCLSLSDKNEAH